MTNFRTVAATILLWLVPTAAWTEDAGPVEPADRAAIVSVIQSQMAAFKRDDGVEAFSYAAPRIRDMFGTPEIFMAMVRSGYAAVYRPREVEFLNPVAPGGEMVQPVRVVGPHGAVAIALYRMARQDDGTWRIAGVVLVPTGEQES